MVGQWLSREVQTSPGSPRALVVTPEAAPQTAPSRQKFPAFVNRRRPVAAAPVESAVVAGFCPSTFLTPGWCGGSLSSRQAARFSRLLDTVRDDVRRRLVEHEFNRSLKMEIYNEFLVFAGDRSLHCPGLDDLGGFWQALRAPAEQQPPELTTFLDLYCSRVAVIAVFKLRFIRVLASKAGVPAGTRAAQNPNHWLSQVFQAGTKKELKARVMESNVFSWYRPGAPLEAPLGEWMAENDGPTISELIKHVSPRVQDNMGRVFSHALSHINFGLFLNSLLINFPLWVETWDPSPASKFQTPDELEIISTKFSGDFLESLAHSHWLAQDNNKDMKWDQILCPDFKSREFEAGPFMKGLSELQFLTFLAEMAPLQGQEPVGFISKVMSGHYQNRKNARGRAHTGAFGGDFLESTYDRVVLNLTQLPKNNPYHWLMGQIGAAATDLKPGGFLVALSGKSLFAPSQKERLQQLLENLELKAVFELEQLKGKGELGSWLYVFRRRSSPAPAENREPLAWFRFSGDMGSFQNFEDITEAMRGFYLSHLGEMPTLWQQEWGGGCRLEFFQDALVDGHLIHSAHEDQSRVTHPRFFKGLLSSCVPLDSVFDLRQMDPEEWNGPATLGLGLGGRREGATFLVVDFRNADGVRAELFPADTFRSVYYDRGGALCHYFLVAPRQQGMDPNVLRRYFASAVGRQLLGLTFGGGTKVKGQLGKMLVPKWFLRGEFLPEPLRPALDLFRWDRERLTATHPEELRERFSQFRHLAPQLFPRYACDVLGALAGFERVLEGLVAQMSDPRVGTQVNFMNPVIQKPLSALPTAPLFPRHADVYAEFVPGTSQEHMEAPVGKVELRGQIEGDNRTWFLEVFADGKPRLRLHSDEEMLVFAQFLFQSAGNAPLGKVLRALRLPPLADLKAILGHTLQQRQVFEALLKEVGEFFDESFRQQILTGDAP